MARRMGCVRAIAAGLDTRVLAKLSTAQTTGIEWHKTLHRIKIPPVVHFKRAGITCSVWLPISVSLFTGWRGYSRGPTY